jgi:hypothetical protein
MLPPFLLIAQLRIYHLVRVCFEKKMAQTFSFVARNGIILRLIDAFHQYLDKT